MPDEKGEVLILDEDPERLMRLFDLVYGRGFETSGVTTSEEALELVARRKPRVLVDSLRSGSAARAAMLARTKELSPETRILFLRPAVPGEGPRPAPAPRFSQETGWLADLERLAARPPAVAVAARRASGGSHS